VLASRRGHGRAIILLDEPTSGLDARDMSDAAQIERLRARASSCSSRTGSDEVLASPIASP